MKMRERLQTLRRNGGALRARRRERILVALKVPPALTPLVQPLRQIALQARSDHSAPTDLAERCALAGDFADPCTCAPRAEEPAAGEEAAHATENRRITSAFIRSLAPPLTLLGPPNKVQK
eukprot:Hpha_TRINITY_DN22492_c0_g1::TRINITY_DN22492_c0_g1_i1::g.95037::m.95037